MQRGGKLEYLQAEKGDYEPFGCEFETYLIDKKHSCANHCMFCFIDQMPKGLRETLYFKDDDERLSFLFGNYITLTNLSEREAERIIKMHISPINISVHTTDPDLRVRMMANKNAGKVLAYLDRFAEAGIQMNFCLLYTSWSSMIIRSPTENSRFTPPAALVRMRASMPSSFITRTGKTICLLYTSRCV